MILALKIKLSNFDILTNGIYFTLFFSRIFSYPYFHSSMSPSQLKCHHREGLLDQKGTRNEPSPYTLNERNNKDMQV